MYYFEDVERQDRLRLVLEEWRGTPFRHWAGVKQVGCDCIHLVARVLEELGLGPFKLPRYPSDWHLHKEDTRLIDGISNGLNVEKLSEHASMLNGDIVLYRFGKSSSHAAIFCDDHVYHAVSGVAVVRTAWNDPYWRRRRKLVLRICE